MLTRQFLRPKETFLIVANKYKENPLLAGTTTAIDATPSDEPKGSTGKFGNKAVFEYDPTGLRSSMTATHEAYQASLKKHLPDHLVTYAWEADQEAIIAKYEALGVP